MARKKISVIIPVYNSTALLKKCVESLKKETENFELVLVNNNSGQETVRYLNSLRGAVRVNNKSNLGFARAVNQGILASSSDILAVVNSDVVFLGDWAGPILRIFRENPKIGAVGPLTNRTYGVQRIVLDKKVEGDFRELKKFSAVLKMRFAGEFFKAHRLVGFCFAVRKELTLKIGLLDERFGTGCYEDFDYSLRTRQAGYSLAVAKDVFVWHNHHSSFDDYDHFYACAVKNREIFVDKWCRKSLEFLDELDPCLETGQKEVLKNGKNL